MNLLCAPTPSYQSDKAKSEQPHPQGAGFGRGDRGSDCADSALWLRLFMYAPNQNLMLYFFGSISNLLRREERPRPYVSIVDSAEIDTASYPRSEIIDQCRSSCGEVRGTDKIYRSYCVVHRDGLNVVAEDQRESGDVGRSEGPQCAIRRNGAEHAA